MNTYYILNSTIFSKAEDVVNALKSGKTIINDDANLKFKMEDFKHSKGEPRRQSYLFVSSVFADDWGHMIVNWKDPKMVVDAMDLMTEGDNYQRFTEWRHNNV